ncbi:ciliary microtubule-associated protein 2 [Latimeria chalumnae]|uniref:Lymphocyte expansion molecule n=1 Tax=Latimeria chalumnae TaxID=7897 RepID=H3AA41_LATCH|nr:PREDICTED: uncharacterized protein C1orf177 homolog [Latimeria chalumnae]XP_014349687.1 PREDICTED: uncharacterized protein C1orf177 homolog [Latimeria chalumnae]|eukprot:XP_014349686.1 PREDICTED: uncharacterized protein C1orf177 homolog [Latimeria chalumnae]
MASYGKKFKGAPFGSQAKRFDVAGAHPDRKKTGTYTQAPYCRKIMSEQVRRMGPGCYDSYTGDFSSRAIAKRASGPGWARAQELERLAMMPHLLYKEIWDNKRFLKRKLGPGSYNFSDFIEELKKRNPDVRGVCETREERCKPPFSTSTPGPGSYGKGGIPSALMDEKAAQSIGICGIMKSTTAIRKPFSTLDNPGPGTYKHDTFTDILLNRFVSKRGPYDLFTGERSKPIVSGHFAAPKKPNLGVGAFKTKSFLDELENNEKKKHGVFGTIKQYPPPCERVCRFTASHWPRPLNEPGPGWYDIQTLSRPKNQNPPPFYTRTKRFDRKSEMLFTANDNAVGVGRYNISRPSRSKTAMTYKSAFETESKRYLGSFKQDKYMQERIRPINIPVEERAFLIPPEKPNYSTQAPARPQTST